jgi:hypothetical protein
MEQTMKKPVVEQPFQAWLREVQTALDSFGMPLKAWQAKWQFDFHSEYKSGTPISLTAERANRFWWQQQNRAIGEQCRDCQDCWLPVDHDGRCQTVNGDLIATNRKKGIVQKIAQGDDEFGQQYITINGKVYWTWCEPKDGVKVGVRVEFTEKLDYRVGSRSNSIRADVAEEVLAID